MIIHIIINVPEFLKFSLRIEWWINGMVAKGEALLLLGPMMFLGLVSQNPVWPNISVGLVRR